MSPEILLHAKLSEVLTSPAEHAQGGKLTLDYSSNFYLLLSGCAVNIVVYLILLGVMNNIYISK